MADLILNDAITIQTSAAIRRGLKRAGQVVLAASDAGAPREPEPRHGVHLTETGFTRVEPGVESDAVVIGYDAFWAIWQEENLAYHHEEGHAKFLSGALLEVGQAAIEAQVGPELRQAFG
jgi:hypothetical protein